MWGGGGGWGSGKGDDAKTEVNGEFKKFKESKLTGVYNKENKK